MDEEARAFGLFGGQAGSVNEMEFIFPEDRSYRPQSKELVPEIPKRTVLRQIAGGGGGYGDPFQRPVAQVISEVRNGILSVPKAQADYGVVLDPETFEVDVAETERLRGVRMA